VDLAILYGYSLILTPTLYKSECSTYVDATKSLSATSKIQLVQKNIATKVVEQ
jgi:hypothetical protein